MRILLWSVEGAIRYLEGIFSRQFISEHAELSLLLFMVTAGAVVYFVYKALKAYPGRLDLAMGHFLFMLFWLASVVAAVTILLFLLLLPWAH